MRPELWFVPLSQWQRPWRERCGWPFDNSVGLLEQYLDHANTNSADRGRSRQSNRIGRALEGHSWVACLWRSWATSRSFEESASRAQSRFGGQRVRVQPVDIPRRRQPTISVHGAGQCSDDPGWCSCGTWQAKTLVVSSGWVGQGGKSVGAKNSRAQKQQPSGV